MAKKEDLDILRLYHSGDHEGAMKRLMSTHQYRLYAHINRMVGQHADTDEVLQQTFIKAWRGLATFKEGSSLSTWLYRIATNASLDLIASRKKITRFKESIEAADQLSASGPHPSAKEIEHKLADALETLPPKQKQVFVMRYYDTLSYAEMAELTGTSEGALKASYHHAVKKIEVFLTAD